MMYDLYYDMLRFIPADSKGFAISSIRPLIRGILSPGFHALIVYRGFRWAKLRGIPTQPLRFLAERLVESTTGISIPAAADIGPGLRIHHFGNIIMHPSVKIGSRCTLYHEVTLGADGLDEKAPSLGDDVLVGAGAKILGDVHVGHRTRVGANAVVARSCPEDAILVGIPARNIAPPETHEVTGGPRSRDRTR